MTVEIGRLCMKTAGRDAGRECLIIDKIDNNFVMIDGNTRRRKCNIKHLEILPKTVKISAKATHDQVMKALEQLGVSARREPKKFAKPKSEKKAEEPKTTSRRLVPKRKALREAEKSKRSLLKIVKKEKIEKPKAEKKAKPKKEKKAKK